MEAIGRRPIRHWQLFDLTLDIDVDRAANSIRGMLDAIQAANPGLTFADMRRDDLKRLIDWAAKTTTRTAYKKVRLGATYETPERQGKKPKRRKITFKVEFSRLAWSTSLSDEVQGVNSEVDPTGPLGTERTNVPAQLQLGAILTPDVISPPPLRALTQPVALEGTMSVPSTLTGPFPDEWFEALVHRTARPTSANDAPDLAGELDALPNSATFEAAPRRDEETSRDYVLDPNLIPDLAVAAWQDQNEYVLPPAIEQRIRDAFNFPTLQRAMQSRNWDTHRGFGVTIEGHRVGFLMEIETSGDRIALPGPEGITVQQGNITVRALGAHQPHTQRRIHSGTMRNGILRVYYAAPGYEDPDHRDRLPGYPDPRPSPPPSYSEPAPERSTGSTPQPGPAPGPAQETQPEHGPADTTSLPPLGPGFQDDVDPMRQQVALSSDEESSSSDSSESDRRGTRSTDPNGSRPERADDGHGSDSGRASREETDPLRAADGDHGGDPGGSSGPASEDETSGSSADDWLMTEPTLDDRHDRVAARIREMLDGGPAGPPGTERSDRCRRPSWAS